MQNNIDQARYPPAQQHHFFVPEKPLPQIQIKIKGATELIKNTIEQSVS